MPSLHRESTDSLMTTKKITNKSIKKIQVPKSKQTRCRDSLRGVSNRWTGFSTGTWDWTIRRGRGTETWDWTTQLDCTL